MYGTYIGNNKMIINLAYNGMLTISANDLSIMPTLVTTGMMEPPLTKYYLKNIKPSYKVVDIGANVGYFTILAAKLVGENGTVLGYEANPEVYSLLRDNISMNWLTKQTKLYNKAIFSQKSSIGFYVSKRFQGESSIKIRPDDGVRNDEYETIKIEANTLDHELEMIDSVDLLKIDIEGGEYQAFLGVLNSIKKKKIKRIVFEWNKLMQGDEGKNFSRLLSEILLSYNGFIYGLDNEGNQIPTTLENIISFEFYPWALIEFM